MDKELDNLKNKLKSLKRKKKLLSDKLERRNLLISKINDVHKRINNFIVNHPELNESEIELKLDGSESLKDLKNILSKLELENDRLIIKFRLIDYIKKINLKIDDNHLDEDKICYDLYSNISIDELDKIKSDLDNFNEKIDLMIEVKTLENDIDLLNKSLNTNGVEVADDEKKVLTSKFGLDYFNESQFKKLERGLKKCSMLAYKKLIFEYYPSLKSGEPVGLAVYSHDDVVDYELELPSDLLFKKIYGGYRLKYSVNFEARIVTLISLEPANILFDALKDELISYKGVLISKTNAEKDKFKIDLIFGMNDKR